MSRPHRAALMLLLLAFAACTAPDASQTKAVSDIVQAEPAEAAYEPPPTWSAANSQVELVLRIDTAVERQPELYGELLTDGRDRLEAFGREMLEFRRQDPVARSAAPYHMEIAYRDPVETSRILSLKGFSYAFAGGAHGNTSVSTVLWNKVALERLEPASLFRANADLSPLDSALCKAINAAKAARATREGWDFDALTTCEHAVREDFALAPGTTPGKAGGLIFLFAPYALGSYAEGGYEVVVPLEAFAALLSPDWTDQFAGAPMAQTLRQYRAG